MSQKRNFPMLNQKKKNAVICIETKIIYESYKEAERHTGVNAKNISKVCRGKINSNGTMNLTAGGFHWCILDDYDENTYIIKNPRTNERQCKVICIETNIVYNSIKDASNKTGIYADTIRKVCNKTKHHNTAGGYHWMFYEDYLKEYNKEVVA